MNFLASEIKATLRSIDQIIDDGFHEKSWVTRGLSQKMTKVYFHSLLQPPVILEDKFDEDRQNGLLKLPDSNAKDLYVSVIYGSHFFDSSLALKKQLTEQTKQCEANTRASQLMLDFMYNQGVTASFDLFKRYYWNQFDIRTDWSVFEALIVDFRVKEGLLNVLSTQNQLEWMINSFNKLTHVRS